MKIVLASKSPRRKEVLEKHGYDVIIDVSNVDENSAKKKDVKELVMELAKLKAQTVAKRHKDTIIVAADTLVYFERKELGQPKDAHEAEEMIRRLIGKTHEVYSGICIINTSNSEVMQDFDLSKVKLKKVSDETLREYIASGQYKGKAGAYNINDPEFENFIDNVKGSYFNVMGLPIEKVEKMIDKAVAKVK